MALEILSLPPEVLTHVFEFLDVNHRLIASRVCKTWLNILNCRRLLWNVVVKFYEAMDVNINVFYHMTRRFECFAFQRTAIDDSAIKFLKKYDTQFVTLSFIDCVMYYDKDESMFPGNILHCDNVIVLYVENCEVLTLFASLPSVRRFDLFSQDSLTDFVVCHLNKCLFKLEMLTLGSDISCDDEVNKSVYVNEEAMRMNPSKVVLSFASIKTLVENNRNTLREIDFLQLQLSPTSVQALSKIEGLKLKNAILPDELEFEYIKKFYENQVFLTSLDLSSIEQGTNEAVRDLCNCLPYLQQLNVTNNSFIDNSVIEIFQLECLELLNLGSCDNISEISFREAVSNLKTFKLKNLDLQATKISDESLFELLKRNRNISNLNLSDTSVSNRTLNMICKNLTLLKYLVLQSCKEISDAGLTGEFNGCEDASPPTPLSNLKNLRELDIRYIPSITKFACLKAIKFPHLELLFLTESYGMNLDDDFKIQLKKQNPRLLEFIMLSF